MHFGLFSAVSSSAEWWPIAAPLVAGAAAIYLLLPRPRAYPVLWGVGLGLLALILTGVLLLRSNVFSPEPILFWSFSALAIFGGALLVTQHNPARAALAFALVVLNTCGLFLLLAAPFLMAATIIIYAGAIIVTFLFVIMLAQQSGLSDADDRSREPLLTTLTGFILLATLLFVLQRYDIRIHENVQEIDSLIDRAQQIVTKNNQAEIVIAVGQSEQEDELFERFKQLYSLRREWEDLSPKVQNLAESWTSAVQKNADTEQLKARLNELITLGQNARQRLGWLPPAADAPFSDLSGPPPTLRTEKIRRNPKTGLPQMPADNTAYLGRSLFGDFLLPVELGGTLLLVATVGAIAIAFRRS
jgi:NADH:ubiquinone oxidoreductase subunit 6 (subunit J)